MAQEPATTTAQPVPRVAVLEVDRVLARRLADERGNMQRALERLQRIATQELEALAAGRSITTDYIHGPARDFAASIVAQRMLEEAASGVAWLQTPEAQQFGAVTPT